MHSPRCSRFQLLLVPALLLTACLPQMSEDKRPGNPIEMQDSMVDLGAHLDATMIAADMAPGDQDVTQDGVDDVDASDMVLADRDMLDPGEDQGEWMDMSFGQDLDAGSEEEMTPTIEPEDPALDGPGTFVAVGWRETLVGFDSAGMLLAERHLDMAEQYDKSLLLRTTTYGPDGFVALGDTLIYWSTDGQSWTASSKPSSSPWISGVDHGNGRYVGAGYNGAVWSEDGRTWQVSTVRRDVILRGLAFGAGTFVAVGEGGVVARSADGESWEVAREPVEGEPTLSDVTYGQGKFVAVGASGVRIVSHDAGLTWSEREIWPEPERTMSVESNLSLTGVVYAKGQWVVVGRKYMYTSPDATAGSWVKQPVQRYFTDVTYGGGEYVGVVGREVWSSVDGVSWSKKLDAHGSSYWGVAFKPDNP